MSNHRLQLLLAASLLALAPACKINESGNIQCNDDANCPGDYPQCVGATAATPGRCAEAAIGAPELGGGTIAVAPAIVTGGEKPSITLTLPALAGDKNRARKVTLAISSGGAGEPVQKTGGTTVALADLGTAITVAAPSTDATTEKDYTYTLTVSNEPGSAAAATATGTLKFIAKPALASAAIGVTPASITGGTSPAISLALPALTSPASSAASVALVLSGCGTGAVTKSGGGAVTAADLGTTITIASPTSVATDAFSCTYTLTVGNAATTPASTVAAGTLNVLPAIALSAPTFVVSPAAITGGLAPTLSATLPTATTSTGAISSVAFTITGCGSATVNKTGGAAVGIADLGTTITFAAPTTVAADSKTCTYRLTVANASASASATGTLTIVPTPVLASASVTVSPVSITGGTTDPISLTLPALASAAASAASASVAVSGCATGTLTKAGGAAIGVADLGSTISVAAPSTTTTSNTPCTYTLTVGNAATTVKTVTATGTLTVIPKPVLSASSLTPSPASITGGASGTTFSIPLPTGTSVSTVLFQVDTGSGTFVTQNKSNNSAVATGDLGSTITVTRPSTSSTDDKTITYRLTASNNAATPGTTVVTGTVRVYPAPVLAAATFTIAPASITGATTPSLGTTLPGLSSAASSAATVSLTSTCGTVTKTSGGGGAFAVSDLGQAVTFAAPATVASDEKTCTYSLTVSNAAATPGVSTPATGTLGVVPTPVLQATTFTPAPARITGSISGTMTVPLPTRSSSSASVTSITLTYDLGSGPVQVTNKSSTVGGGLITASDLGTTITIDRPSTLATDSKPINWTLTARNNATTPTETTATGTQTVVPKPALSAETFTVAPARITGASSQSLGTTLPTLTSAAASAATVTFEISNCGTGAVAKTNGGGGAVGVSDLSSPNNAITFASPSTANADNKDCTYTLTVSNDATTAAIAQATGTLAIVPRPFLNAATFTPAPAVYTGGAGPATISIPLPPKTSSDASVSSITFTRSDGTNTVTQLKTGDVPVALSDLSGGSITVDAPGSSSTTNLTYTYTLTISNSATTAASAAASGTVRVAPLPVLSPTSFTLSPSSIGGGVTPATITTTLPQLTSPAANGNTVDLTVSANCGGGSVTKTNRGGGAINLTDLGQEITFTSPTTLPTDDKTCTYTLAVTNAAGATGTTASGQLVITPQAVFVGTLSVVPNIVKGGTSTAGLLKFTLPELPASYDAATVTMTVTPAGGATTAVLKTGAQPFTDADLNHPPPTVSVDPPSTTAGAASLVHTYSLSAVTTTAQNVPAVTTTVTSYPAGASTSNVRLGSTSTLLPNGKVLIVGGGTGLANGVCSGATTAAEVYDPSTGTSATFSTNPTVARCQHTATLVTSGGTTKVYVIGGAASNNVDVFTYNAVTSGVYGSWATSSLPTINTQRWGHSATLLGSLSGTNDGKIVVAGGYAPGGVVGLNDLEAFNPATGTSTDYTHKVAAKATNLSQKRGEHVALLAGKYLYFIGGRDNTAYKNDVDSLDTSLDVTYTPDVNQIVDLGTPANALARAAASGLALTSTKLLVVGGIDGSTLLNNMQTWTLNGTGGVTSVSAAQTLTTARARFAMLPAGPVGKVIVLGGTTAIAGGGDTATDSIEIIDTSASTLTKTSGGTMASPRHAFGAVNLNLSGASNAGFVLSGGMTATANGIEFLVGP